MRISALGIELQTGLDHWKRARRVTQVPRLGRSAGDSYLKNAQYFSYLLCLITLRT